eukprot:2172987-Amphidinium_carterae.1
MELRSNLCGDCDISLTSACKAALAAKFSLIRSDSPFVLSVNININSTREPLHATKLRNSGKRCIDQKKPTSFELQLLNWLQERAMQVRCRQEVYNRVGVEVVDFASGCLTLLCIDSSKVHADLSDSTMRTTPESLGQ